MRNLLLPGEGTFMIILPSFQASSELPGASDLISVILFGTMRADNVSERWVALAS